MWVIAEMQGDKGMIFLLVAVPRGNVPLEILVPKVWSIAELLCDLVFP
jgi:hypothetical protein